ncbi:RING-H2 finger protein ATL51-like protein [Drosera capensis]
MSTTVVEAPLPGPPLPSIDCSLGLCTVSCPQYCVVFAPPITDPSSSSLGYCFSPLIITLITFLLGAFPLLCCYTVISRYCKRQRLNHDYIKQWQLESRLVQLSHDSANMDSNLILQRHQRNSGIRLDERFIKLIPVFKYMRGDKLFGGTECAVCLSQFRDLECLRLMPNCQHAFHVECIDKWLKSQLNCPCRSLIHDDDGPAIQSLQVVGDAYPGGATNPTYVVTADDVDKYVAIECIPVDDTGRQILISFCFVDPEMQLEIDTYLSEGHATFSISMLANSTENWEPATLKLIWSGLQVNIYKTGCAQIVEKFSEDLSKAQYSSLDHEKVPEQGNFSCLVLTTDASQGRREAWLRSMYLYIDNSLKYEMVKPWLVDYFIHPNAHALYLSYWIEPFFEV